MKATKFFIILLGLSLGLTLFTYTPSLANTYVSPWITLSSPNAGNPGGTVQVIGYSFAPNMTFPLNVGPAGGQLQNVGATTTDRNGFFKANVAIPSAFKAGDKLTVQVATGTIPVSLDFMAGNVPVAYQNNNSALLYDTGPSSTYYYGYNYGYSSRDYQAWLNTPPSSKKLDNPNYNDKNRYIRMRDYGY